MLIWALTFRCANSHPIQPGQEYYELKLEFSNIRDANAYLNDVSLIRRTPDGKSQPMNSGSETTLAYSKPSNKYVLGRVTRYKPAVDGMLSGEKLWVLTMDTYRDLNTDVMRVYYDLEGPLLGNHRLDCIPNDDRDGLIIDTEKRIYTIRANTLKYNAENKYDFEVMPLKN
jgi:hypothetical protein